MQIIMIIMNMNMLTALHTFVREQSSSGFSLHNGMGFYLS